MQTLRKISECKIDLGVTQCTRRATARVDVQRSLAECAWVPLGGFRLFMSMRKVSAVHGQHYDRVASQFAADTSRATLLGIGMTYLGHP